MKITEVVIIIKVNGYIVEPLSNVIEINILKGIHTNFLNYGSVCAYKHRLSGIALNSIIHELVPTQIQNPYFHILAALLRAEQYIRVTYDANVQTED